MRSTPAEATEPSPDPARALPSGMRAGTDDDDFASAPVLFARAGTTNIAYQAFGTGPPTVVAVPPMAQNVEHGWGWPAIRAMLERFGSFCRYVHFDKRGTGASDRSVSVAEIDQRVDDLRAVMDHAEIGRAFLFGTSEGGPMSLLYAATYPDRVAGIVLDGSGARLVDNSLAARLEGDDPPVAGDDREAAMLMFADRWGTADTLTPDLFAPSLAADPEFRQWHERYERQAASRDAILTLLRMNGLMDARAVLPDITVPVLMLHRVDDPIVPIRFAREAAAELPNARLVELPGADHFTYAADLPTIMDEIEQFVTGSISASPPTSRSLRPRPHVEVTTLGRFAVTVDGEEVAASAWGSRRARQLLKRLVVAEGWPVTRDELCDLLWPDEPDHERLRPRLSVQLSTVRRILDGGVIADRSTIRLDIDHVHCDLVEFSRQTDDRAIVESYRGDLLPDDQFEDWVEAPRAAARSRFLAAARRSVDQLLVEQQHDDAVELGMRVLTIDPHDLVGHRAVIVGLSATGSHGAAREAYDAYATRMRELGVDPDPFEAFVST